MFTSTEFRSKFVKTSLSQNLKEMRFSLVQYFYKIPEARSKIVLKVCRSPVLLKLPEPNTKIL